jgi:integrase/recombinase XerD
MTPLLPSMGAPVRNHRNGVRNRSESLAAFNRNSWPHSSESACESEYDSHGGAALAGKQAKILSNEQLNDLLLFATTTRHPVRNKIIVLLSAKAGLRAGEIANLTWDMVLDSAGQVGSVIELRDHAAKKGSGRRIPTHSALRAELKEWLSQCDGTGPVVRSERSGKMTAVSIVNWFALAYQAIGLEGCSSHSGRRTFITRAARLVHRAGGSLRDVQLLAGHRSIQTTQRYIDGDSDVQRKLVSLI